MQVYFINCVTEEEVRIEYRKLAFTCHPDHGGSNAAFQDLQNQYNKSLRKIQNRHKAKDEGWSDWYDTQYEPRKKYVASWKYEKTFWTSYPNTAHVNLQNFMRSSTIQGTNVRLFIKKVDRIFYTRMYVKFEAENKKVLSLVVQMALLKGLLKDNI